MVLFPFRGLTKAYINVHVQDMCVFWWTEAFCLFQQNFAWPVSCSYPRREIDILHAQPETYVRCRRLNFLVFTINRSPPSHRVFIVERSAITYNSDVSITKCKYAGLNTQMLCH